MPKNTTRKIPYKGKGLIDKAIMDNQVAIYGLVEILRTPGLNESELYRRLGVTIDQMYRVNETLKAVPAICKEEVEKQNALDESQSAEQKNNQLQEV